MRVLSLPIVLLLVFVVAWATQSDYSSDPDLNDDAWLTVPSTGEFWPGLSEEACRSLAGAGIGPETLSTEAWRSGGPVPVKRFAIMRHEVSCAEYAEFLHSPTGESCTLPSGWDSRDAPAGRAQMPVTGITLDEARLYASFRSARVPSELEWEYAIRGFGGKNYPWGNTWAPDQAVVGGNGPVEVGNGYENRGLFNFCGNVAEWTVSTFDPYPGASESNKERGTWDHSKIVTRGGSWADGGIDCRMTSRNPMAPGTRSPRIGFRLVKSLP